MVIPMTHKQPFNYYIAACDKEGGLYRCTLNEGKLKTEGFTPMDRPMYMVAQQDKMYVLLRDPLGDGISGLQSFDIAEDGSLQNPSEIIPTMGKCACHLAVEGEDIYCVNYLSGNVFKAPDKTAQHEGVGVNLPRQDAPHTHFAGLTPDKKYVCITDLGLDKIFIYNRELTLHGVTDMPSGHGPRHLAFHPNGTDVFCINELSSTLTHLKYSDGTLNVVSTLEALPQGFEGKSIAAAVRIEGDRVYVSNRGDDSVAIFRFAEDKLTLIKHISVYGNGPRDFWVDNGIIISTNENSGNVAVINETDGGLLSELKMPSPLCVLKI